MQKAKPKKFRAYWGSGYYHKHTRIVTEEFFTEDEGYDPEHIEKIKALEVGQTLDLTEVCAVHKVKRIQ